MTPAQKRLKTIKDKLRASFPKYTEQAIHQVYLEKQRRIAAKGGKKPTLNHGFKVEGAAQRAQKLSVKARNAKNKSL